MPLLDRKGGKEAELCRTLNLRERSFTPEEIDHEKREEMMPQKRKKDPEVEGKFAVLTTSPETNVFGGGMEAGITQKGDEPIFAKDF